MKKDRKVIIMSPANCLLGLIGILASLAGIIASIAALAIEDTNLEDKICLSFLIVLFVFLLVVFLLSFVRFFVVTKESLNYKGYGLFRTKNGLDGSKTILYSQITKINYVIYKVGKYNIGNANMAFDDFRDMASLPLKKKFLVFQLKDNSLKRINLFGFSDKQIRQLLKDIKAYSESVSLNIDIDCSECS